MESTATPPTVAAPLPEGVQEGAIASATVLSLTPTAAVVSFGWKADGLVPWSDIGSVERPGIKVGDRFEVLVESLGNEPGEVVLSKDKARKLRTWDSVIALCKSGSPVPGTVMARVTGGYTVDIGLTAFLPNSQSGTSRSGEGDAIVGQTMTFSVIEFNPGKPKIVLSRKAFAEAEAKIKREALAAKLAEGSVVPGVVRSITDFGAFIDLGGMDGLLHVSEMSWAHIDHPRQAVRVGQELKVKVLKFDAATGKVGLGLRQLLENPWAKIEERFPSHSTIEGKVSGLTDFGAFVTIAEGVEGLIHVSEMSWTKKVKHPSDVLKVGESVKAVVLRIDPEAHRISLGLRQLQPNPWDVIATKYPEGARVQGTVKSITDFGVFLELEEGIEGLVHVSELSWTEKVKHPGDHFKVGDSVAAQVLRVDVEDQRMALGVRQLEPSPWQSFGKDHPVGSRLKGRVARVVDFGAFVEVAPGIEGLLHVSELRDEHVDRPGDLVKVGQEIEVQVVEIDQGRRKVALSVKALTQISRAEYEQHLSAGDVKTTLGDLFKDQLTKK